MSPRRTRVARTSRTRPARRARLLTRRAKASAARRPRRGVLLLVVLSLLVLFLMVGTAFVITAKQSEKAAKSSMKHSVRLAGEAAQADLLDEVLLQIIRDTNNPNSSLRGHSLLGDMYGNDGLKGVIEAASPNWAGGAANPTGGQMLEFQLQLNDPTDTTKQNLKDFYGNNRDAAGNFIGLSNIDNAYNGQILTFLSGPAKGRSTRIVGYIPPNTFRMMNVQLADGSLISNPGTQLTAARVLINGRPFSGTGVGFNPWAFPGSGTTPPDPKLNASEVMPGGLGTFPLALMPNASFLLPSSVLELPISSGTLPPDATYAPKNVSGYRDYNGRGGANEGYDAADFQNMHLAVVPGVDVNFRESVVTQADLENTSALLPNLLASSSGEPMVVPSWHRPELINYWGNNAPFEVGGDIRKSELAGNAMMLRRVLMRPNWLDHPNFNGSNPDFAIAGSSGTKQEKWGRKLSRMVYGPWDVDNDNDGVRDSIWVDVGFPVMAGPNGKLVKPLAAVMIVDMDGRLNVNAHGALDLADFASTTPANPVIPTTGGTEVYLAQGLLPFQTANPRKPNTPRGAGFGPADISLDDALGSDFGRLLRGAVMTIRGQSVDLPGRYGFDSGADRQPGLSREFDIMSQVSLNGWPYRANQLSSFGSSPDLRARYGVAVNDFGQPIFESTLDTEIAGGLGSDLILDSPYELNLSADASAGVTGTSASLSGADAPFAVAELERVLRVYDADAGALPPRLSYLAGIQNPDGSPSSGLRDALKITTDSFDLPSPNVALPHELEGLISQDQNRRAPRSVAELMEIRVREALFPGVVAKRFPLPLAGPADQVGTDAHRVRAIVRQLLAPELADGVRLNVNRPLGNGRDDQTAIGQPGYGVVDEPGEVGQVWSIAAGGRALPNAITTQYAGATFPVTATEIRPSTTQVDGTLAQIDHRQFLARHLYVTALTLCVDEGYTGLRKDAANDDQLLARRIAQWAINVVDFRDPDNIMTPFEYDLNPFDGWNVSGDWARPVDGDLATTDDHSGPDNASNLNSPNTLKDDTYVWGAEKPELLMTETLAWHDRRSDDIAQENPYPTSDPQEKMFGAPVGDEDKDFDQLLRPKGAFFVELYNPSEPNPSANADTHERSTGFDLGVNLAAVAIDPAQPQRKSPVWRMTVHKRGAVPVNVAELWDPDDRDSPATTPIPPVDRSVYFAGFDPEEFAMKLSEEWDADGVAYFNDDSVNPVPSVRPGRFLVVGSGDRGAGGVYANQIGGPKDRKSTVLRRRIELATQNAPHSVSMIDSSLGTVSDPKALFSVQAPAEGSGLMLPVPGDARRSVADVALIDQVFDLQDNYDDGPAPSYAAVPGGGLYAQRRRRLTITEPAIGYITRFNGSKWSDAEDEYEPSGPGGTGAMPAIDIPLDGPIGGKARMDANLAGAPVPAHMRNIDEALCQLRPISSAAPDPGAAHSVIFLQRLANPLLPWNPMPAPLPNIRANGHDPNRPVNPYMTVDTTSANVTVFNSRGRQPEQGEEEDASDTNEAMNRFTSFERGFAAAAADPSLLTDAARGPSLWGFERPSLMKARNNKELPRATRPNPYKKLPSSDPAIANKFAIYGMPFHSLGFTNTPFQDQAVTGAGESNDAIKRRLKPRLPFEWVNWNNRPYVSGNELLLVPRWPSSQLTRRFKTLQNAPPTWSPYDPGLSDKDQLKSGLSPLAHLENLFAEENGTTPLGVPLHLYRVLEYVHTPSLYAGAQKWVNPGNFSAAAVAAVTDPNDPRITRQAPFNAISEFHDPGRINLNTIVSAEVWAGIFHDSPDRDSTGATHPGPDFDGEFVVLRRGYGLPAVDKTFLLDNSWPTFFGNPFRGPDAGALVPLASMRRTGVDSTLFRSTEGIVGPTAQAKGDPLFSATVDEAYHNADRHANFFFKPMTRLGSLTTNRSNVYAVWVTIGFFEVEEVPDWNPGTGIVKENFNNDPELYNRVYPEGYTFGREDGVDVGNTRRLRGFYILDRTRMAGYEPGADHNVENVVRLRRRIE